MRSSRATTCATVTRPSRAFDTESKSAVALPAVSGLLTVVEIVELDGLGLARSPQGPKGLSREVTWLHVSSSRTRPSGSRAASCAHDRPRRGELATRQRAYVRRLADHGLAGLGFGVGFGFAEVPRALADEADRLGFPVLGVPYEVPFVAITKTAVSHIASERLERLTQAIAVHERLADAVLKGEASTTCSGSFAVTSTAASSSSTRAAAS